MAAAAQPSGQVLACDVYPGQAADDPLYLPLIRRLRQMLGRSGLLYVADSKMAALATRADLAAYGDYYLMPLPLTGETGQPPLEPLWDEGHRLGEGYEFERHLSAEVGGEPVAWTERVQVVRSLALAQHQADQLEQRLVKAEAALRAPTPAPARGRRQYRDEAALQAAVADVMTRYGMTGLLRLTWQRE